MLTPREAFKVGFLAHCAKLGMDSAEIEEFAKSASALVKEGFLDQLGSLLTDTGKGLGNMATSLGTYGVGALLAAPPVIGAGTGYLAGRLTDVDDEDVDSIKQQELIDEYLRNAEQLRHRNHNYRSLRAM